MNKAMPTMHLMRWVLAIVAVIAAWLVGGHFGAQKERKEVVDELTQYQSDMVAIEKRYKAQVAQLRAQRDIANASNESLQKSLKDLQTQSLEQKSAQRLYEKIEGKDVSSGLGVGTITRVSDAQGNLTELHVTVVQARGRNRVKGQIGLALLGERDGKNVREEIVSVDSSSAPRFDMRFFQTLIVPIPEQDILIDLVEIAVKPVGKQHKSFNYEMDWSGILEN